MPVSRVELLTWLGRVECVSVAGWIRRTGRDADRKRELRVTSAGFVQLRFAPKMFVLLRRITTQEQRDERAGE